MKNVYEHYIRTAAGKRFTAARRQQLPGHLPCCCCIGGAGWSPCQPADAVLGRDEQRSIWRIPGINGTFGILLLRSPRGVERGWRILRAGERSYLPIYFCFIQGKTGKSTPVVSHRQTRCTDPASEVAIPDSPHIFVDNTLKSRTPLTIDKHEAILTRFDIPYSPVLKYEKFHLILRQSVAKLVEQLREAVKSMKL